MQSFAFYAFAAACIGVFAGCSAGGSSTPTLSDPTSGGSSGTAASGGSISVGASGGTGGTLSVGGSAGTLTVEPGMGEPGQAPARTCEICEDLPVEPIITDGTPMTTPSQFSGTGSGAGPCIAEPADGALFPWNWLRPRIRWAGSSQVYEVRISTARQKNTLVAYTNKSEFYIPREVWSGTTESQGLARNNYEEDITITVRGASGGAVTGESSVKFRTAAVDAGGSMVYWANVKTQTAENRTEGDAAGWLMGFSVGDEAVVEALRVLDVTTQSRSYAAEPKAVTCIGCHSSTPDGNAVGFTSFFPWIGAIAGITEETRGKLPDFVTPTGLATTQQMWMGAWTFSPGQWTETKKIGLASYGASTLGWPDGDQNETGKDGLLWMNLAATTPAPPTQAWELRQNWAPMAQGTAFGLLARTGDSRGALMPDFANDGSTIAYTSTSTTQDGRIGEINDTDIYTVPYNDGKGGAAAPLPGAATVGTAEYYPNYAADDAFVAFNHIDNVMSAKVASPQGFDNHLYYRPESEIWITPTDASITPAAGETSDAGGIRLKANDADACNTLVGTRKGLANSWAKFSPRVNQVNGKTYYWLIFSSTRDTPENKRVTVGDPQYRPVDTLYSRLYMAAFVVEGGTVTTYPACTFGTRTRRPITSPPRGTSSKSRQCHYRPIRARLRAAMAESTSPFDSVPLAAPDPILGVTDAFNADKNPKKVNLGVGVYQDAEGRIPILRCVHEAEKRWLELENSKAYLPIDGLPAYRAGVQALLFGNDHPLVKAGQVVTAQALGGTGGLRIGADFLRRFLPSSELWVSSPTWENHRAVFEAAGFKVNEYPYYDPETKSLSFPKLVASLRTLPAQSIVLLHGCCHNPTGADLAPAEWKELVGIVEERSLVPFIDLAYQGFAEGLEQDAYAIRVFADAGVPMVIASSFSKSFSLYRERVGALTLVTSSADEAKRATSQLKRVIRPNYSNPSSHGAQVIALVLGDAELRRGWEAELAEMRDRIRQMRTLFVQQLAQKQKARDFSFVEKQRGMFSYSGLELARVQRLRSDFALYLVDSGRMCVAAMNEGNLDYITDAIAKVV